MEIFPDEPTIPPSEERTSFPQYLVRFGIAHDEKQATLILLIVSCGAIILSIILLSSGHKTVLSPVTSPSANVINPAIIR